MGDQDVLHVHCRGMDPHLNKVWVETKCAGAQLMVRARLPEAWGEARGLSLGMASFDARPTVGSGSGYGLAYLFIVREPLCKSFDRSHVVHGGAHGVH